MRYTYLLVLVACGSPSSSPIPSQRSVPAPGAPSGGTPSAGARTGWAVGYYFAPEYINGTGPDQPDMGITFSPDGSWAHTTAGSIDVKGRWDYAGQDLRIDGRTLARMKNCMAITYDGRTYYRDDIPAECPDKVPELTAAEKCLVGEFNVRRDYSQVSQSFTWTRTANRLEVFEQSYSDAHYTVVSYWSIQNGKLCTENGDCKDINWGELEAARRSTKDPGCVVPVNVAAQYCSDSTGASASGDGCVRENRYGMTMWKLSCYDDIGYCACTKNGATLWSGRTGDYESCYENDVLWNACCGQ